MSGKANARILAITRSDGSVAVAYDACALCGAAGYVQEDAIPYPLNIQLMAMRS